MTFKFRFRLAGFESAKLVKCYQTRLLNELARSQLGPPKFETFKLPNLYGILDAHKKTLFIRIHFLEIALLYSNVEAALYYF